MTRPRNTSPNRWCRDSGANEVSLHVAAAAADSRRFYERNGLEEAQILMIKRLGSDEPM
jgi:hypothetical protein